MPISEELKIHDSMGLLLPTFARRVRAVCSELTNQGFDPMVFETFRTRERADILMRQGKSNGADRSFHCLSAAADIISASKHWDHPEFFKALGEIAQDCGLVWGGTFKRRDLCHVQAISDRNYNALKSLPTQQRDAYINVIMSANERKPASRG